MTHQDERIHTLSVSSKDQKIKVQAGPPGIRWVAGLVDFVILISATTIYCGFLHEAPFFFTSSIYYFTNLDGFLPVLVSTTGLVNLIVFMWIAFLYFFLEGIVGTSVGKKLFSLRIAGNRSVTKSLARSLVKSVLPLSLIDFLFVYKNRKYNQRLSDKLLELSVAVQDSKYTKRKILPDKNERAFVIAGFAFWIVPLLSYIFYVVVIHAPLDVISTPTPNEPFEFVPNIDVFLGVLLNNAYLAYVYYEFGGIFLCLPMLMQLLFQSITIGTVVSGILFSNWEFFAIGVMPHMIIEMAGFSFCLASGLVICKIIMDLIMNYKRGVSLDSNRIFLAQNIISLVKLSIWGFVILCVAALFEIFITPILLRVFYFF